MEIKLFKGDSKNIKQEIIRICHKAVEGFSLIADISCDSKNYKEGIRYHVYKEDFATRVIKAVAKHIVEDKNFYVNEETYESYTIRKIYAETAVYEANRIMEEISQHAGLGYTFKIIPHYFEKYNLETFEEDLYLNLKLTIRIQGRMTFIEVEDENDFRSKMHFLIAEEVYRAVTGNVYERDCKDKQKMDTVKATKATIYELSQRFKRDVISYNDKMYYIAYKNIADILNGNCNPYDLDCAKKICREIESEVLSSMLY